MNVDEGQGVQEGVGLLCWSREWESLVDQLCTVTKNGLCPLYYEHVWCCCKRCWSNRCAYNTPMESTPPSPHCSYPLKTGDPTFEETLASERVSTKIGCTSLQKQDSPTYQWLLSHAPRPLWLAVALIHVVSALGCKLTKEPLSGTFSLSGGIGKRDMAKHRLAFTASAWTDVGHFCPLVIGQNK